MLYQLSYASKLELVLLLGATLVRWSRLPIRDNFKRYHSGSRGAIASREFDAAHHLVNKSTGTASPIAL